MVIKYSRRIDAADFSDGQQTCCMLPLRPLADMLAVNMWNSWCGG